MFSDHVPITAYDELGETRFVSLMNEVLGKLYHKKRFIPGPICGQDGGIDAEALDEGVVFQYKWKEVARYDRAALQNLTLSDLEKAVDGTLVKEKVRKKETNRIVFITNVSLTSRYLEKVKQICMSEQRVSLEYWHFEKVNSLIRPRTDLHQGYFPIYTRGHVKKLSSLVNKLLKRKEIETLNQLKGKKIKRKFEKLYVDCKLKEKYYLSLIFLIGSINIKDEDKIGMGLRKKLRELFRITKGEESSIWKNLLKDHKVMIVGDLLFVKDKESAERAINDLISNAKFDIQDLIKELL